jgi:outer membrane receptor protein involved in Fe transport
VLASCSAVFAQGNVTQTVVVTGSRIRTEARETSGPVTMLDEQHLTRGGNDSLGKVLQTLPYNAGSPKNTNVNSGGDGSTRIDLRGLGPNRTVILLNGRRLPTGGIGADSSVDIDTLPLSMVERVEVLSTGASAVYGADAIGGVINVITRTKLDGIDVGAQRSETERGDGAINRAQIAMGHAIGTGHWILGIDYTEQKPVPMDARAYSAIPLTYANTDGERVMTGSPAIPDGRFMVPDNNVLGLSAGQYTRVPGATGQTASDWRSIDFGEELFNFAPYTYLQTPNERRSVWVVGNQPLGGAELFVEGLFTRRDSSQKLAPAPYIIRPGQAPSLGNGRAGVPASNLYNPFGAAITGGSRRLVELVDRGFTQRVDVWRALAGIRGTRGAWTWEASIAMSDSDAVTRELGLPLTERFISGLGPSGRDASGHIVCGAPDPVTDIVPASGVIGGCIPINLFGGAGTITQAQLDYIARPIHDSGYNKQRLANVAFEGPWGRVASGEIRWALGGEFRRESGGYEYDPLRAGGTVSTGLASDIPGGEFEALEAYAEVHIPILDASSGWGDLSTTLGARLSDFDTFGTHTSWHAGLRWQWTAHWTLRADYSTLFRAPALSELYETQLITDQFQALDPCGHEPTPEQQLNCTASGVPGASYVQEEFDSYVVASGGNPKLKPEEGHSTDVGIEFRWIGAASWQASLDFFKTQLDHYVERPEEQLILSECANHGTQLACDKIRRFSDGRLEGIDTRISNVGHVKVTGIDLAAQVGRSTRAGNFALYVLVTRLRTHELQTFEGSETIDRLGHANFGLALPEWRSLGSVRWTRGAWSAGYTLQWIGKYTECSFTFDDELYCARIPSVLYHDLDASYHWDKLTLHVGIGNLSDKDPPYLNQEGNTNPALYRLLGRAYFLQLEYASQKR